MRSFSGSLLLLAFALALPLTVGCEQLGIGAKKDKEAKKDTSDDEEEEEEKAEATATATATETAVATATATAEATASATATESAVASVEVTASASASGSALAGHTAVPTNEEWDAVKEVTVLNSTRLGCETKALREWVRVTCKNRNDTGGTPTTVTVDKGGEKGDTFTLAGTAITSLVFPFEEGRELEATFGWTDKSVKFKSLWPKGLPKPPAYGAFDAPAPGPVATVAPTTSTIPKPDIKKPVNSSRPVIVRPGITSRPVIKAPTRDPK